MLSLSRCSAPILFFIHSFVILLHSADNPISQLESKDPDWPSTTAFGRAESSAEGISRLVVSLLGAPRPREEGADSEPSELSAEEHRIERMKLIVPIWSFAISRAAWVQCMSARRLRRALESAATAEEQEAAIKQLNSLRMTMDTVLSCLDCMRSDGAAWRNVYDAYSVTHRAAVRIMDGEKWEPGELFSDEEVAKLGWWVDTKAFNHESFASK